MDRFSTTMRIPGHRVHRSAVAGVGLGLVLGSCVPIAGESPPTIAGPMLDSTASRPTATPLEPIVVVPTSLPAAVPLTEPGCCAAAWWSPESDRLLFVDDPPGEAALGVYAAPLSGGPVWREGPATEDPASVAAWLRELRTDIPPPIPVPEGARSVAVSPDGSRVAWTLGASGVTNLDLRQRTLWTADSTSGAPLRVGTLIGGDLIGWAADGLSLIVTGSAAGAEDNGLWTVPLDGGAWGLLQAAERVRSPILAPGGGWVAFYRAFEGEPAVHGVWVVEVGGDRVVRISDLASYRWRDSSHLVYFPYAPDAPVTLRELAVETGETRELADEGSFPGGIAANDWSVSPTGEWIAYRSAADGRLWAVRIADR